MTVHGRARAGLWIVPGVVVLVAGHGIILYYGSSHAALSGAVLSSVAILVIVKHLGLVGSLYALLRRRLSQSPDSKDRP